MLFDWIFALLFFVIAWASAGLLFGLAWYGMRQFLDDGLAIRIAGTVLGTALLTPRLTPVMLIGYIPIPALSVPVARVLGVPQAHSSAWTVASFVVTGLALAFFMARAPVESRSSGVRREDRD